MAPTKPKSKKLKDKGKERERMRTKATAQSSNVNVRELLATATAMLAAGDHDSASRIAKTAYEAIGEGGRQAGAALTLLGQIQVEVGELDRARSFFLAAVAADQDGALPEDMGGGPEKFLWLAQLSEEGGADSVSWFERGAAALRSQIQSLSEQLGSLSLTRVQQETAIAEKKRKLAETLCAVVEVYMTDLSWEEDAEQRCEALITEATMLAPDSAETWQTVANVRISQERTDEARVALKRSLELWVDLQPEDPAVPDFPTRVSLVRLLIEVGMEEQAIDVAERLIIEDDSSVEVWYLGGYSRYTLGERLKQKGGDEWRDIWRSARKRLAQCLRIFEAEEYEDERLGDHAKELLSTIKNELGDAPGEGGDDEEWEDTDGEEGDEDEDEEMQQ
ncbi:hypothetical protein QBC46DRAFT_381588 [Diplogelasinospora grovesii]|uniref:Assembly chaperone of rpl4 n=1 Tax=Diplogelasinospora grovesii TaxID=303347 RepID=A0AAN6S6N5_9PEZI|nr:hypothetical protein QBC46DRAFT_381588 [Diplogelasinospora grovesii]